MNERILWYLCIPTVLFVALFIPSLFIAIIAGADLDPWNLYVSVAIDIVLAGTVFALFRRRTYNDWRRGKSLFFKVFMAITLAIALITALLYIWASNLNFNGIGAKPSLPQKTAHLMSRS